MCIDARDRLKVEVQIYLAKYHEQIFLVKKFRLLTNLITLALAIKQ